MNNYFCNYVLTIKQLKDRFLWRGGRGVKTPLGRYPFKKEEGVLLQGQHCFFLGGGAHCLWSCVPLIAKEEAQ